MRFAALALTLYSTVQSPVRESMTPPSVPPRTAFAGARSPVPGQASRTLHGTVTDLGKRLHAPTSIGVCMIGGRSQTPYRPIWQEEASSTGCTQVFTIPALPFRLL